MAVRRQRLYRKGKSGYDKIHMETDSTCVFRSDGTTDIETSITNIETTVNQFKEQGLKPYHAGTTAPTSTNLLWVDTTANTGGLKYYNGTTWVVVPVSTV